MATEGEELVNVEVDDVTVAPMEPELAYEDDALSVRVGDDVPATDAEKEALKAQLAARDAEVARLANAPVETIAKGLEALSKGMRPAAPATAPIPGQQPGESLEEFEKRYNEQSYENPFRAALGLLERYKGSEDASQVQRNLAYSKAIAQSDPVVKATMSKYAD
jgi:hypothetical protein